MDGRGGAGERVKLSQRPAPMDGMPLFAAEPDSRTGRGSCRVHAQPYPANLWMSGVVSPSLPLGSLRGQIWGLGGGASAIPPPPSRTFGAGPSQRGGPVAVASGCRCAVLMLLCLQATGAGWAAVADDRQAAVVCHSDNLIYMTIISNAFI